MMLDEFRDLEDLNGMDDLIDLNDLRVIRVNRSPLEKGHGDCLLSTSDNEN